MFKWPQAPSANASGHEIADFSELQCWRDSGTSVTALSQAIGRIEDNDYFDGVPEEDESDLVIDEAYAEIDRRERACRNGYPFVVGEEGQTLLARRDTHNHRHLVYRYLLLATRLNMKTDRVHAGIDGALLFEKLAAEIAREYFGPRSKSIVFGTAAQASTFPDKVNNLCRRLGEGGRFVNRDQAPPKERDGKLDIVAWTPFSDGLAGKLIAFGQCKTGTSYRDLLTQLRPDSFCNKWLRSSPVLTPVRMFFVSEALSRLRWRSTAADAGLLFDRCRIVDFADEIDSRVLERVTVWTEGAAKANSLPSLGSSP